MDVSHLILVLYSVRMKLRSHFSQNKKIQAKKNIAGIGYRFFSADRRIYRVCCLLTITTNNQRGVMGSKIEHIIK